MARRGFAPIAPFWGLLCRHSHFQFKRWFSPLHLLQNYFLLYREVARPVTAAFSPGLLLFHHYSPPPPVQTRSCSKPGADTSQLVQKNNGPLVLEILMNRPFHCFDPGEQVIPQARESVQDRFLPCPLHPLAAIVFWTVCKCWPKNRTKGLIESKKTCYSGYT